jgi:hypothetical protein
MLNIVERTGWKQRSAGVGGACRMLLFALIFAAAATCFAQSVPPIVATTQVVLASYTYPPPVNGNALLQGAGFGTLAIDQLGDVFIGAYNSNAVYEFPANGGAPVAIYNSSSGGHAGAVALDPHQNLAVSERFNDFIYLIPFVNGAYTPYSNSSTAPRIARLRRLRHAITTRIC